MANNVKISTVCFTGHRYIDKKSAFQIPALLKSHLRRYIDAGAYRFRVGGAMGFDTVAALCVLELLSEYPHLELELVIPCPEQTRGWNDECRRVYNYIMKKATKYISICITLCKPTSPAKLRMPGINVMGKGAISSKEAVTSPLRKSCNPAGAHRCGTSSKPLAQVIIP